LGVSIEHDYRRDEEKFKSKEKVCVWSTYVKRTVLYIFVPCVLLGIILPSKKDTYFIIGAYMTQEVLTSDTAKDFLTTGNETVSLFIERTNLQLSEDINVLNEATKDKVVYTTETDK